MISARSVAEFVARPRDDFLWLKEVSSDQLRKWLAELNPAPDTSELMQSQLVAMLVGIANPTFFFKYGMGTGKTLICLRLTEYWALCGMMRKAFVISPSQEAVYTWEAEAIKWKFSLPFVTLAADNSTVKAERWLEMDRGIGLIGYPSLRSLVMVEEPILDKFKNPTGRFHETPRRRGMEILCKGLDEVIFDEITEAKETDSLVYRTCRAISMRTSIRYGLAGRPFGRDVTKLWGQHFLIDHGETYGPNLEIFRAAFFDAKKKYFGGPFSFDYKLSPSKADMFAKIGQHRALQYKTEEVVDLPPLVRITKDIPFPEGTLEYYQRVMDHLMAARGDAKVIQNDFLRLRQLGSGFLGIANDEFGAKAQIKFDKNPKLNMLIDLIKQIPEGGKCIVVHEYTLSGENICARLKKEKIKHVWMYSGTKDRRATLHKFQNDPECEVLVMNHMVGSHSLNLQMANWMFIYESPVGVIDRDQLEHRFWRKGQTQRCILVDLVMTGGVEQTILDFHTEGEVLWAALTRDPRKVLAKAKTKPKKHA